MDGEKGFIQVFIDWIIHHGGLFVLLLIIFAETGLFIGFFFPGDSLLFAAGIWVDDLAKDLFNLDKADPVASYQWITIMIMVMIASMTSSGAA